MSFIRKVYNYLTGTPVANGKMIENGHDSTDLAIEAETAFQEFEKQVNGHSSENGVNGAHQNGHSNGVQNGEANGLNGHAKENGNGTNGVEMKKRAKVGRAKKANGTKMTKKETTNGKIPMVAKLNDAATPRCGFNRSRGMVVKNGNNNANQKKNGARKNGKKTPAKKGGKTAKTTNGH